MTRWWIVGALLVVGACGAKRAAGVSFDGRVICVPEARTVDLGAGQQARAADAGQCKTWPESALITDDVRRSCGPCGFSFDAAATKRARAGGQGDACCYAVSSPPPPPRP